MRLEPIRRPGAVRACLLDRNPQRFVPSIFEAEAGDFVKAIHRVHRSALHASRLRVPVLP